MGHRAHVQGGSTHFPQHLRGAEWLSYATLTCLIACFPSAGCREHRQHVALAGS